MNQIVIPIFFIFFLVAFGITVFAIIASMKRAKLNSRLPRITALAEVVAHRKMQNPKGPVYYYLTFRFESGDEYEYSVTSDAYSYFVVGDKGKLTTRGSEYISFEI